MRRKTELPKLSFDTPIVGNSKRVVTMISIAYEVPKSDLSPHGRIMVAKRSTTRKTYCFQWPELEEVEVYAIGFLTFQWAYLEHIVYLQTKTFSRDRVPPDALSLSFKTRLRIWHDLAKRHYKRSPTQLSRIASLHNRITTVEKRRHQITHGIWHTEIPNVDRLILSSFRPPFAFVEHLDVERVLRLGEEIGAICLSLHFPRGPDSMRPVQSYMSRGFVRMMTGQP